MRYLLYLIAITLIGSCNNSNKEKEQQKQIDSLTNVIKKRDDSVAKENQTAKERREASKKEQSIVDERNAVISKVIVGEPQWANVDDVGGVKNIRFTLFNDYKYKLEQVILHVHYIRFNGKEIKSEPITQTNVAPNSRINLTAPDYTSAGKTVYVTVESVLCKAISLCYYNTGSNISDSPDPYKCK